MTEVNKTCPVGYSYLAPSGALPGGACKNPDTGDFFAFEVPNADTGLVVETGPRNAPMAVGAGGGAMHIKENQAPVNPGLSPSCSPTVTNAGMTMANRACEDK